MINKKISMLAIALPLLASACAGPSLYTPLPQTNFAYPNSDVAPLSHVIGTSQRSYFFPFQSPEFNSAEMRREAYANALVKSGGDLIIDGDYTVKVKMIPLAFITLYTVDATVEGTAARMTAMGNRPKADSSGSHR